MLHLVASVILSLVILGLVVRYVRYARRRRNDNACPHCRYLTHPQAYEMGAPCSECGMQWGDAERLIIRKGRWCLLGAMVSLFLAIYTGAAASRAVTLVRLVPDWAIVRLAPELEPDEESGFRVNLLAPLRAEIERRALDGEITPETLSIFAQRIADRLARDGELVRTRDRWPRDLPMHVRPANVSHFSVLGPVMLRITTASGALVTERTGGRNIGNPTLPVPEEAIHAGVITLDVQIVDAATTGPTLATRRVELPIEFVHSWSELLSPVAMPLHSVLDLRENIRDNVQLWRRRMVTGITVSSLTSQLERPAVGLRIEIVQAETVLASTSHHSPDPASTAAFAIILVEYPIPDLSQPRFIRIVPDPEVALRDFDKDTFWNGEPVILPIPDRERN